MQEQNQNEERGMVIKGQWVPNPTEDQILEAERGGPGSEEHESAFSDKYRAEKFFEENGYYPDWSMI